MPGLSACSRMLPRDVRVWTARDPARPAPRPCVPGCDVLVFQSGSVLEDHAGRSDAATPLPCIAVFIHHRRERRRACRRARPPRPPCQVGGRPTGAENRRGEMACQPASGSSWSSRSWPDSPSCGRRPPAGSPGLPCPGAARSSPRHRRRESWRIRHATCVTTGRFVAARGISYRGGMDAGSIAESDHSERGTHFSGANSAHPSGATSAPSPSANLAGVRGHFGQESA